MPTKQSTFCHPCASRDPLQGDSRFRGNDKKKRWIAALMMVFFFSASASADDTSTLLPTSSADEKWSGEALKKVNQITDCLKEEKDPHNCIGLTTATCKLHAEACNYMELSAWKYIGRQAYRAINQKWPNQTKELQEGEISWENYMHKFCNSFSETNEYPEEEQPKPPFVRNRDYTVCVLNKTARHVIELRRFIN